MVGEGGDGAGAEVGAVGHGSFLTVVSGWDVLAGVTRAWPNAPSVVQVRAASVAAAESRGSGDSPASRPTRVRAMNASPPPSVSTTCPAGAAAQVHTLLPFASSAPAAPR